MLHPLLTVFQTDGSKMQLGLIFEWVRLQVPNTSVFKYCVLEADASSDIDVFTYAHRNCRLVQVCSGELKKKNMLRS